MLPPSKRYCERISVLSLSSTTKGVVRPHNCCPEVLWVPHSWRCPRPWMGTWTAWAGAWFSEWQPCPWSLRSLPTQAILWFHNSLIRMCRLGPQTRREANLQFHSSKADVWVQPPWPSLFAFVQTSANHSLLRNCPVLLPNFPWGFD